MAARINLLPWRVKRRKQREREFLMLLGAAALVGVLLVLAGIGVYSARIDNQQGRNNYLRGEITKLEEQIREIEGLERQRQQLISRKDVIERLQATRTRMVHLVDELVRTIPEGVRLAAIKQAGTILTLEGFAQSQARVSNYMRRLDESEWLTKPDLSIIEASGADQASRFAFVLRVVMTQPGEPEQSQEDSAFPGESRPQPPQRAGSRRATR
jgi:type IV pilus assembly protein PilN